MKLHAPRLARSEPTGIREFHEVSFGFTLGGIDEPGRGGARRVRVPLDFQLAGTRLR